MHVAPFFRVPSDSQGLLIAGVNEDGVLALLTAD